jgi:hypothetical protein
MLMMLSEISRKLNEIKNAENNNNPDLKRAALEGLSYKRGFSLFENCKQTSDIGKFALPQNLAGSLCCADFGAELKK